MDLLFSLSCVDKFQLIPLIVSMWDIKSSFSKLRENISWYFCCGHKPNPLALQMIICVTIDYYSRCPPGSGNWYFLAFTNNSDVVCCLFLRKILFSVASSLDSTCLALTFPSGYVQRSYINALDLTELKLWQPNAIVLKEWPFSL